MNADTDALTERLWEAVTEVRDQHPRVFNDAPTDEVVAAVLPIVEAEVRTAKAEALREAAEYIDGEEPHHLGDSDLDPLDYNTLGEYGIDRAAEWLRAEAAEYEAGESDER